MAKYNFDFKLRVVKEYLEGPISYNSLAKKYQNLDSKPINKRMGQSYKAFGEEGLRKKRSKKVNPVQFKLKMY